MAILIPVQQIMNHCNPFIDSPWGVEVTKQDVKNALDEGRLINIPGTNDHAGRIAYLVQHPANDAIEIDVGIPNYGCYVSWYIGDGNHRLAAAIFSGRSHILAGVSGSLSFAQELFGMDCSEPEEGVAA